MFMCHVHSQAIETIFITQIGLLCWDHDVKPHFKNDTCVACLEETQLPWAFLVSESADQRETCWHVAKFVVAIETVAQVVAIVAPPPCRKKADG